MPLEHAAELPQAAELEALRDDGDARVCALIDWLAAHRASLSETTAAQVDAGAATGTAGELLALRVRSFVAYIADEAVARCGRALGPAPLAFDEEHARRVADLQLYVRQHHAERDLATLGRLLIDETTR